MNQDILNFFGLTKPFRQTTFLETPQSKQLTQNIKSAIHQGGIVALTGMVGSGKTTLLRKIKEQLLEEKQVIVSRSLSTDKKQVSMGTLYTALFYDLVKEKNFSIPTQAEKRERKFLEIIKKQGKPIALFIDEAHDLHHKTLVSLKRLIELTEDTKQTLCVVVAGHPKLGNDLRRPSMEEIGARSQIFTITNLSENKTRYCEWLIKQCCEKDNKPQNVISPEALEFLANSLVTPLQINYYLTQALEKAYLAGCKPLSLEIIQSVLSPDIDGIEAKLARHGYNISALCEILSAKPNEIRSFFHGCINPTKAQEFNNEIHKLGII